jgi:hypothetical protein
MSVASIACHTKVNKFVVNKSYEVNQVYFIFIFIFIYIYIYIYIC